MPSRPSLPVIPAKAGTHATLGRLQQEKPVLGQQWVPAFAGMTTVERERNVKVNTLLAQGFDDRLALTANAFDALVKAVFENR
jgi:hypothetical protein